MRDDIIKRRRQKVKIWTKEDYELAMRIHAYLINEYGWLIPYLFLKYTKNNENKEKEKSNKQEGDEE